MYRNNYRHVNVQRHCVARKRKRRNVYCEFQNCSKLCEKIRARTLVVSWAWTREGMVTYKPNGEWDHIAEDMMINFIESGHPAFRGPSVLYEDLCQAKEEKHCLCISVVMLKQ